jgi:tetrapyrrole methylase family protein / MazG family protein
MAGRRKTQKKKQAGQRKLAKRKPAAQRSSNREQLSAGEWFERLVELQRRLRAPDGCPWDREQTHASLRTYMIEEVYEVLDALESGEDGKFAEEMGDLLLQVVFHSQIAAEEGRFTVADVIREIHEKMVRRHPHVFGEKRAKDAAEVLKNWEQIKAQERQAKNGERKEQGAKDEPKPPSLLDGVSRGLPATLEGYQLTRKASRIGFDWPNAEGILEKMREEAAEVRHAVQTKEQRKIEEEVGDLLFAVVNLSRFLHVDPEIALKKANAKFSQRFRQMEQMAASGGQKFADVPREEKEQLWEATKREERNAAGRPAVEASPKR